MDELVGVWYSREATLCVCAKVRHLRQQSSLYIAGSMILDDPTGRETIFGVRFKTKDDVFKSFFKRSYFEQFFTIAN